MTASFIVSMILQKGFHLDSNDPSQFAWTVLITVGCSTVAWLLATLLTPPEDTPTLLAFYRRARPSPTFWGPIASQAPEISPPRDGWLNLLDWIAGCAMVYCILFGAGKIIFGQVLPGSVFIAIAAVAGGWLYWDLNHRNWNFADGGSVHEKASQNLKSLL